MTTYIVFREGYSQAQKEAPPEFERQLERLLDKERIVRQNSEHFSSMQILKDIVFLCYQAQQWPRLNELIPWLLGRRGQSKRAQTETVQLVMSWLATMQEPHRTMLIETLKEATAKKIFLEVEHARCVLLLVKGKEEGAEMEQAARLLQEVQVETYGSMDRREKLEFILYQMKILLRKQDYVRFFIVSKKVNENGLNDAAITDLKLTYFSYMAIYFNQEDKLQQACRTYCIIYQTLHANKDKAFPEVLDFNFSLRIDDVLSNYVALIVLQPRSAGRQQQLRGLYDGEQLQKLPQCRYLASRFLHEQIISCKVEDYRPQGFELFQEHYPKSKSHLQQLRRMLIQHDLRVISKYYFTLRLSRVAELLRVQAESCEDQLCVLNNAGAIQCRIDRIDGVVDFTPIQNEQVLLSNWNNAVNGVLDMVEEVSELIRRERKVHGV